MGKAQVEPLEPRQHLTGATLSTSDVRRILAQAGSQTLDRSLDKMVIAVCDREANVLGVFARSGHRDGPEGRTITLLAIARARTAALFQSRENAFSTRTARFIIQDHFPTPVRGTPGGPLYGVQFSNLVGSDVVGNTPAITGDPGGVPLFKDGEPVGGIGVAGDFADVAAREDLIDLTPAYAANPGRRVFNGREESDLDEAVALAGAQGFMAPESIRANRVFLDGLALPFIRDRPRSIGSFVGLTQLTRSGRGTLTVDTVPAPAVPFPTAMFAGVVGQLKRQDRRLDADDQTFGIVSSNDADESGALLSTDERLTARDVSRAIERAVSQATRTRAAIRLPIGQPARVHVSVVDRDGDLLGVFRMDDGTNFSFDVSVQKARTAAFFSDDSHALTTRAVGFLAQRFFPIGIDDGSRGPLFRIQNALSPGLALRDTRNGAANPLRNGITIFPGGVPLYKNGRLVGAIGVSGDGVDQDDVIAFAGAGRQLQAPAAIRSDVLDRRSIRTHVAARAGQLFELFGGRSRGRAVLGEVTLDEVVARLDALDFRLPYVKLPRNPRL